MCTRLRSRTITLLGAGAMCLFLAAASCPSELRTDFVLVVRATGTGTGTVSTPSGRIACEISAAQAQGDCHESYVNETGRHLYTAVPASGSTFAGWLEAGGQVPCTSASDPTCEIVSAVGALPDTVVLVAHFVASGVNEFQLDVTVRGDTTTPALILSNDDQIRCRIRAEPTDRCTAWYAAGTTVALGAHSLRPEGQPFDSWAGCTPVPVSYWECTVVMDGARSLVAHYDPGALSIEGEGTGTGTVTSYPAGIDCTSAAGATSGTCVARISIAGCPDPNGLCIYLTATPAPGSVFAGWRVVRGASNAACPGTGDCTVTPAARVSARFELDPGMALAVSAAGSGTGIVTSSPAGITCTAAAGVASGTCTATYGTGTQVTLTATPGANATFAGWSGGCSGSADCIVTLTAATNVTATFDLSPIVDLTVSFAGTGTGTVTSSPAGIDCANVSGGGSSSCTASFVSGTDVTLTATPNGGSTFTGWAGGGCTGTGTCVVTMSAATNVQASFTPPGFGLTVSVDGTGTGIVTETSSGIACSIAAGMMSGTCSSTVPAGMVVFPIAAVEQGSIFAGWGGDCSGTGLCMLPMTQARAVTATFTAVPTYTLTIRQGSTPTGNGVVSSSPTGISCVFTNGQSAPTGTCVYAFPVGTVVTLIAGSPPPSVFAAWLGAPGCTNGTACVVTMDQDRTVDAVFNP